MTRPRALAIALSFLLGTALSSFAWPSEDGSKDNDRTVRNREIWDQLSEEDRERHRTRYRRYLELGEEQRDLLRVRHSTLEDIYGVVVDEMSETEGQEVGRLGERRRRERIREMSRQRLERLQEDLRRRFENEAGNEEGLRALIRRTAKKSDDMFRRRLRGLVKRGWLPESEARELMRGYEGAGALERLDIVREVMVRFPDAFQLERHTVARLQRAEIGDFARYLSDRMNRQRRIPREFRLDREQVKQLRMRPAPEKRDLEKRFLRRNVRMELRKAGVPVPRAEEILRTQNMMQMFRKAKGAIKRANEMKRRREGGGEAP